MNLVHRNLLVGGVGFDQFVASGDAESLVVDLAIAEDLEKKRRQRAERGESRSEDWDFPEIP
jgi:hypothetical protein